MPRQSRLRRRWRWQRQHRATLRPGPVPPAAPRQQRPPRQRRGTAGGAPRLLLLPHAWGRRDRARPQRRPRPAGGSAPPRSLAGASFPRSASAPPASFPLSLLSYFALRRLVWRGYGRSPRQSAAGKFPPRCGSREERAGAPPVVTRRGGRWAAPALMLPGGGYHPGAAERTGLASRRQNGKGGGGGGYTVRRNGSAPCAELSSLRGAWGCPCWSSRQAGAGERCFSAGVRREC